MSEHASKIDVAKLPGWTPVPDRAMVAEIGLLTPDGLLYPCTFWGHYALSRVLGIPYARNRRGGERELCLRLSYRSWEEPACNLTMAQYDALIAWCTIHGEPIPGWLEDYRP